MAPTGGGTAVLLYVWWLNTPGAIGSKKRAPHLRLPPQNLLLLLMERPHALHLQLATLPRAPATTRKGARRGRTPSPRARAQQTGPLHNQGARRSPLISFRLHSLSPQLHHLLLLRPLELLELLRSRLHLTRQLHPACHVPHATFQTSCTNAPSTVPLTSAASPLDCPTHLCCFSPRISSSSRLHASSARALVRSRSRSRARSLSSSRRRPSSSAKRCLRGEERRRHGRHARIGRVRTPITGRCAPLCLFQIQHSHSRNALGPFPPAVTPPLPPPPHLCLASLSVAFTAPVFFRSRIAWLSRDRSSSSCPRSSSSCGGERCVERYDLLHSPDIAATATATVTTHALSQQPQSQCQPASHYHPIPLLSSPPPLSHLCQPLSSLHSSPLITLIIPTPLSPRPVSSRTPP